MSLTDRTQYAAIIREALPAVDSGAVEGLAAYMDMLIERNRVMNLTAITEPQEIALKHFADSLLPASLIPQGAACVDVGTGAGFPGLPLKLVRPDISMTFIDSLNKRIAFLREVCDALGIKADFLHARAEDAGRGELRGRFDAAFTRAVAPAPVLLEYTAPLLKVGGVSLMYKGAAAADELSSCEGALKALYMSARLERFDASWGERCVIVAEKLRKTPSKYPRKAGTASKEPL